MDTLGKYFHTLRHLRPGQIIGRALLGVPRSSPDLRHAPAPRTGLGAWLTGIRPAASMIGPDQFRLLNLEASCAVAAQWRDGSRAALWNYNLHYFDDLNAMGAEQRLAWHEALIARWIAENPVGQGVGWEPYPVSRRIVNWVKWAARGHTLSPAAEQSLAIQARWLARRVERHLQGNHVVANAKALLHAGVHFEGAEAQAWLEQGLSILRAEVAEQVLPDGGHFERSPMYHAGFLEDLLDSVNMLRRMGREPDFPWQETAGRMLSWLDALSHPDGDLSFFNDAAFAVAPAVQPLRAYASRLGLPTAPRSEPLRRLQPSGYVVCDMPPFYLLCDVAPLGPDHLPGHGHADTLSFELSVAGRRVFVNSGTGEYGSGPERQRQRGSEAHNTLVVDGENSSEVWAGFRVARRARARLLDARIEQASAEGGRRVLIVGEHDGYRRLQGRNQHRRQWSVGGSELCITDVVSGAFRHAACHFHLHPDIQVRREAGAEPILVLSDSRGLLLRMRFDGAATVDIERGTWHPQFGVALPNGHIIARLAGATLTTSLSKVDS